MEIDNLEDVSQCKFLNDQEIVILGSIGGEMGHLFCECLSRKTSLNFKLLLGNYNAIARY